MRSDSRRNALVERRDQALADMRGLDRQVADGEITATAATVLRQRYEVEAVDAAAAIDSYDASPQVRRSSRRSWIALAGVTAALVVAFIGLINAVEPRPPGGFITGGIAADVARDGGVDLSRVTNDELEAVVAANPEVIAMRLALARRYVEAGDFSAALPHYFEVLDREPNEPEALMYLGWMTTVSGEPATGASLLERSLEVAPDNLLAMLFLASTRLYGLDDPDGAIPLLEVVIASGAVPDHVLETAEVMLAEARQAAE